MQQEFSQVVGNDDEKIFLHNTKHGETVTLAEELDSVSAITSMENIIAFAIAALGEIWMIKIKVPSAL